MQSASGKSALISRRTAIGGALTALLGSGGRLMAQRAVPDNPFIVLLDGVYQPVAQIPNLGLSAQNQNDGSYITTNIYRVSGLPGTTNQAVGSFFVSFSNPHCFYNLPGGAIEMVFTEQNVTFVSDGMGGQFMEGTFELTILEATGIYRRFEGGHNHMVDKLHFLANGSLDEHCFCIISH